MEDIKKFRGAVLRAVRKIKAISPKSIAKKISVNLQTVYGYEHGKFFPKNETAENYFAALDIDKDLFYQLTDPEQNAFPCGVAKTSFGGEIEESSAGKEISFGSPTEKAREIIEKTYLERGKRSMSDIISDEDKLILSYLAHNQSFRSELLKQAKDYACKKLISETTGEK